jgi:hypothetical protein
MRQIVRVVAYPVMVLSAAGVLASFCLSFASVTANPEIQKSAFRFLFPGIFLVWLPTILFVNWLTRDFKQRDLWKAALRGCPTWMRTAQWVVWGLAFAAFFAPFLWGSKPGGSPVSFLLFPAIFYSTSFCVAYSILHVEKYDAEHCCLNGHRMSPSAKFCEECGAPATPPGTRTGQTS